MIQYDWFDWGRQYAISLDHPFGRRQAVRVHVPPGQAPTYRRRVIMIQELKAWRRRRGLGPSKFDLKRRLGR